MVYTERFGRLILLQSEKCGTERVKHEKKNVEVDYTNSSLFKFSSQQCLIIMFTVLHGRRLAIDFKNKNVGAWQARAYNGGLGV